MKKPKYRLQTVLEMREQAKKDAAQFLVLRRQQLAEAEKELQRCQKAVQDNLNLQRRQREIMMTEMHDGTEARRAVSHRTYIADLREQELDLRAAVVKQEKIVEKAQIEVDKALEMLTEATKEVKVIEKHRETWRSNVKKEAERKEQKLNDEIGAILFQNHSKRNKN